MSISHSCKKNTMTELKDLKPCPFCGENEQELYEDDYGNYAIRCQYCDAQSGMCGNRKSAIEEWQKRV